MSNDQAVPEGWETTSGLALDDADIEILGVSFRYDAQYNNGETLLAVFEFRNEDEDEEGEQFFPCGKGWEPADKGQAAVHESGKSDKKFHKNTAYGELIDSALAAGAGAVLGSRGPATRAEVWTGLRFHAKSEDKTFKVKDGNELVERTTSRIHFTEFLGEAGAKADEKPAKAAAKADEGDESTSQVKAESNGSGPISGLLKAKLTKLAKEHDSHDTFMEKAFEVDGVMGVSDVENAIMDASDSGFYATARA